MPASHRLYAWRPQVMVGSKLLLWEAQHGRHLLRLTPEVRSASLHPPHHRPHRLQGDHPSGDRYNNKALPALAPVLRRMILLVRIILLVGIMFLVRANLRR